MSFPRYPKYKASGVEWLGDVPEHWDVNPLKYIASFRSGGTPSKKNLDYWEGDVPWASSKDLKSENLDDTQDHISQRAIDDGTAEYLPTGSVLVVVRGMILLHTFPVTRITRPMTINQDLKALTPRTGISSEFLAWLLRESVSETFARIEEAAHGTKVLRMDLWTAMPLTIPPSDEQTAIAAFLDRETAKIDGLVVEQRGLMALLKEKRQAVISHAVTKGLNPNAPMKPSGIEWLGDVPKHWEVQALKKLVAVPITDGPHETPQFINEGVPFVSAEAVSSGRIDFTKVRACISEADNARYSVKYTPKLNDIYMVKSGATTGVTAMVEDRTDFNIWSPLAAIRCNGKVLPKYVLSFLRSRNFQEAVTLNWSFGTQQNIGMRVIENLACTVPPIAEQTAIVQRLSIGIAEAETLIAEAERAIALLQERRTALISAAVTGKIDVRAA